MHMHLYFQPVYFSSMASSVFTYLNGLTALFLSFWGLINFIRFSLLYFKEKKKLQPFVALLGISMGSFSLGAAVSFISLLITGNNINYLFYGYLSYTLQPVTILAAMYIGFEIFNKEKQKLFVSIFTVLGVVFLVALYVWPEEFIKELIPESGELIDVSLGSIALLYSIVNLLSLPIIISRGFASLRQRVSDPEAVRRSKYLVRGWIVFAIAAILETVLASKFVIVPRVFMMAAFINIFAGFTPIKKKKD